MNKNMYIIPLAGLLALLFTYWRAQWVARQDPGTDRMKRIAGYITDGAMAFLRAEYSKLVWFVVGVALLLAYQGSSGDAAKTSAWIGLSFVVGASCSALAGFIGMKVATKANVRTAHAARTSLASALTVAFRGGSVMGMGVVGLGVLGLSGLFFFFYQGQDWEIKKVITVLTGFSFGASSIALFARVGGGIYTKAADVGADLVGKVEAGIPEDHPLNPATIADNVGDNVGDVAGMGADLFESYVGSMIAAMVLGAVLMTGDDTFKYFKGGIGPIGVVMLPLCLAAIGIEPAGPDSAPTGADEAPSAEAPEDAPAKADPAPKARTPREGTKQAKLIEMLRRPDGATIDEIAAATQWQPHTIRGAFAGALKKRLGLEVTSEKVEGRGRVYKLPVA